MTPRRHTTASPSSDHVSETYALRMNDTKTNFPTTKSDAEWRAELTPDQYKVLREKGTERAFTGDLWDEHRAGTYRCAGCSAELFDSDTKFEYGTGWPSFYAPANPNAIATETTIECGPREVIAIL